MKVNINNNFHLVDITFKDYSEFAWQLKICNIGMTIDVCALAENLRFT